MIKVCEVGWFESESDKRIVNVTDLASIVESAEIPRCRSRKGNMNKRNTGHTMFGQSLEAIILAIDIGKNSKQRDSNGITYFEKSIYCASMILKRKILNKSEDYFTLILFGSSHTINHLSSEGSCYDSIETVAGFGKATWDLFNRVNSLSPTNITHSDWISTFVLAADFLRNETENKVFAGLQVIMFSNLTTDISFKNIDTIASCLKKENIRLSIIGKNCEASSSNPAYHQFLVTTGATAIDFNAFIPKISSYNQKKVITKTWNAPLSYEEVFDIKVFGYEKKDITTKSSNYDTQDLSTAKKKHSDDNKEQMEVDNKLPMDNFYFGDDIIPVIDLDTDECTYIVSGRRCLQVLGFVKATTEQKSFLMGGGSYIFKPHTTDQTAFDAIFKSMVERREVMIVRKVDLYINLVNIGALFPRKMKKEKFFMYVSLPYDEEKDYTYKLPSLDSIKLHLKEKIAIKRKNAMDIDIDDGNTFAMPENRYDLELQSMYDCIVQPILTKVIPRKIQRPKKPLRHRISLKEYIRPNLENIINKFSFRQEFFENLTNNDNNMQSDHYEEFHVSNELTNPSQSFIKNEFNKIFSIKQEVSDGNSSEIINSIHLGCDEELKVSNELTNPPQSFIENEFKNTFQEVFDGSSVEDNNTTKVDRDEESDISNQCVITQLTPIEDFKKFLKNGFDSAIGIPKFVFSYRSIFICYIV
eukprot:XP_008179364.1 PREDICTED: uncharacterized protein LOC100569899 [Acyrthosiphon pisum]